jgi:uncharacterized protein (TIRG00374 family)
VTTSAVYLLSWPLRGLRYRDVLRTMGFDGSLGFLTGAIFVSQTGNLVFPARLGDGVRAYVMKARRRVPYPSGFASLAVERVFDLMTIAGLAGAVMLALVATGNASDIAAAIAGEAILAEYADYRSAAESATYVAAAVGSVAIAAVVGIFLSARSDRDALSPLVHRLSDDSYTILVIEVVGGFVTDVQAVARDGRAFAAIGAASLLVWTLDVATAMVVMLAVGIDLPLAVFATVGFFAVSVGNLAKVLPLSPGGIGLYEAAFTVLAVGLAPNVSVELAIAAAVVDHAVKNVITIAGGLASMTALNVSLTEAVEESRDAQETADPGDPANQ